MISWAGIKCSVGTEDSHTIHSAGIRATRDADQSVAHVIDKIIEHCINYFSFDMVRLIDR